MYFLQTNSLGIAWTLHDRTNWNKKKVKKEAKQLLMKNERFNNSSTAMLCWYIYTTDKCLKIHKLPLRMQNLFMLHIWVTTKLKYSWLKLRAVSNLKNLSVGIHRAACSLLQHPSAALLEKLWVIPSYTQIYNTIILECIGFECHSHQSHASFHQGK